MDKFALKELLGITGEEEDGGSEMFQELLAGYMNDQNHQKSDPDWYRYGLGSLPEGAIDSMLAETGFERRDPTTDAYARNLINLLKQSRGQ